MISMEPSDIEEVFNKHAVERMFPGKGIKSLALRRHDALQSQNIYIHSLALFLSGFKWV